jgi:Flp pilus assembly protein TadG
MKKTGTKGQSLVEFALTLVLVIFMITMFLDLGRVIYTYLRLSSSVREGARSAIVTKLSTPANVTTVKNRVNTSSGLKLNINDIAVSTTVPASGQSTVTVKALYNFKPATPGLAAFIGNGFQLKSESTMLIAPNYR